MKNWLPKIRESIHALCCCLSDKRLSEAALLQQELEKRDHENPHWDEKAHEAVLEDALRRDVDREHLISLYGASAVQKIETKIQNEPKTKRGM